jgi:hypothetical protein
MTKACPRTLRAASFAPLLSLVLAACASSCWADSADTYMLWSTETTRSSASIDIFDFAGCLVGQSIPNARGGYDYFDAQGMFVGSTRCPTRDRIEYFDIAGRQIKSTTTGPLGDATLEGQYGQEFFLTPRNYMGSVDALDSLVLDPLEVKDSD